MLVVFGGLPGTGKTTIARAFATQRSAVYLRIDEIEQAIRTAGALANVGPVGYAVAYAIAASNLAIDGLVVADCVNPVPESREAWRATARRARKPLLEIEVICSDPVEHRRRVEERRPDIDGHELPSWKSVLAHDYAPWSEPRLVIDTAALTPDAAIALIERALTAPA